MLIRFCALALLACLLSAPALPAWAEQRLGGSLVVSNEQLRILWPGEESAPTQWDVAAGSGPPPAEAWHSIVSRDGDGPVVSRHLRLGGPDIAFGPWRQEGDGGAFARVGRTADGALQVSQALSGFDQRGHRWRLTVAVERDPDAGPDLPGEDLTLSIGPGLGERPDPGFGYAQWLYSFVEIIGSIDGRVVTYPASSQEAHVLDRAEIEALDWIGLHSRYFALVLMPANGDGDIASLVARPAAGDKAGPLPPQYLPEISLSLATDRLAPGEGRTWELIGFSGPKSRDALAAASPDLTGLLFPGLWEWMRWLTFALWAVLAAIHGVIPNLGVAILVLAVIVRIALYPLAKTAFSKQMRFAAAQEAMKPELEEINKIRDGGERSERIVELYNKHGVSPLGALMPLLIILIQVPIFVALFHLLGQAYEMRSASFLWMDSLAEPDKLFRLGVELPVLGAYFNLLPALMAVTTIASIMTPPTATESGSLLTANNIAFSAMGLVFFVLLYPFPSGMVLYWTAANVLHLAQSLWHRQASRRAAAA